MTIAASNIFRDLILVRDNSPLVHSIANYVVMPTIANVLLALGASPLMAQAESELEDISKITKALVINIGTLDDDWIRSMELSQDFAHQCHIPIVLDPVGAGASRYRTTTALSFLNQKVTVLRGNASEILALAGENIVSKGVDATVGSLIAEEAAEYLAKKFSCVVVVSGSTDIVIDHCQKCYVKKPDFSFFTKVTAMGCSLSAVVGAFLAINSDYFSAAAHAMATFGVAGEVALKHSAGPGIFYTKLLDSLSQLRKKDFDDLTIAVDDQKPSSVTEIKFPARSKTINQPGGIDYSFYIVADSAFFKDYSPTQMIDEIIRCKPTCVQLRGKTLSDEQMTTIGKVFLNKLRPLGIPLIINDSVAIAKLIDADGVHLGQQDASIEVARRELGPNKIIGLSVENEMQAVQCAGLDADYFGVGPIFVTSTKLDAAIPLGVAKLAEIRKIINTKPMVAIGGIGLSNVSQVLQCKVDGIAVVSSILGAENPQVAANRLHAAITLFHQSNSGGLKSDTNQL